ncbi:aromatic amino acid hydroxylase [Planctobacterium marinum]|uniref:Phenylalanine 4-monooxygenase n=1 Tax=Planctobacterium marinum TaxID=1631968 RepID=A0AA48KNU3_9ALTE|nr:phenylalanine 4-monooxygenase [Planctobacterium marinum]
MYSQQQIIDSLPSHLRPFIAHQDYNLYTPRDQAVWRFLMHQLVENLSESAHPIYLEGLRRTGINIEEIPKIEVMNDHLNEIGWRAAVVDGFIPPAIFIEFLAHRVLVVAVNIRSYAHMLYTPAPDIIHESAGHAPFIIDIDYAEYLQRMGELGRRVITNKGDIEVYEAIRSLSIVKESPNATQAEIDAAETHLKDSIERKKEDPISEAALMSRLQWWTTEYGLVGTVDDYKIFGAGLLSSLGESLNCLDDQKVKKLPLTLQAIATDYDITREQPQLFVARSCRHLSQVAEEFARNLACNRGGKYGLDMAIAAETVNTAVYNSGLEVSGLLTHAMYDPMGNPTYIKTTGPTQLSYNERQLSGHGIEYHEHGFGSPVGKLVAIPNCLSTYHIDDLRDLGIEMGKRVTLNFLSGVSVEGMLKNITRRDGKNLLFTFEDCTVTDLDGTILFDPGWGVFDMAVGYRIDSVYGGSADPAEYPLYNNPSDTATVAGDYDATTLELFSLYGQTRGLRENQATSAAQVEDLIRSCENKVQEEWLLIFELLELAIKTKADEALVSALEARLESLLATESQENQILIRYGINRIATQKAS